MGAGGRAGPTWLPPLLADKVESKGINVSGGLLEQPILCGQSLRSFWIYGPLKRSILHFKYYNGFYQDNITTSILSCHGTQLKLISALSCLPYLRTWPCSTLSSPGGLGLKEIRWRKTEIYPEALGHVCEHPFTCSHLFYTFGTYLNVAYGSLSLPPLSFLQEQVLPEGRSCFCVCSQAPLH